MSKVFYNSYFLYSFYTTIYLSYICLVNSPCYTNLAYSKEIIYRKIQKILKQMILYSIVIICQPYEKYIYFKVDQLQYETLWT